LKEVRSEVWRKRNIRTIGRRRNERVHEKKFNEEDVWVVGNKKE
jgi:hypothetical protein